MNMHKIISKQISLLLKATDGSVSDPHVKLSRAKVLLTVSKLSFILVLIIFISSWSTVQGQSYKPALFSDLHWRAIGPLRGGRMHAIDAVPGHPTVFYAGADNGGIWKSTSNGRKWVPIFDKQSIGSIGSIAVAPSNPNIIYVGTGTGRIRPDGAIGNGMYKSTDAGEIWTHLGLRDTQKINKVIVDPNNPNRLFVAAMGHPYGPNEQRGIFRSMDGGKTFEKVHYIDKYTSGYDVDFDPTNPQVIYATMWEHQQAPWENGRFHGTSGGVFKSTDGGDTWTQLTNGLPEDLTQVLVDVAPSDPTRIFASVATGRDVVFYRSDNSGKNWRMISNDPRSTNRVAGWDMNEIVVDPKNPDILYSVSTVLWKSTNGGKTWAALRGAIGGDDYQRLWINPKDTNVMFAVADQGALISVNGGKIWSSWYNQPLAAMYDVATTNEFPYRVCGGQQDSGSACVASRGNDGQLTAHDWHPAGVTEYGRAAPDPLNPNLIYGGHVSRYNRTTGQIQYVGPPDDGYRSVRTMPLIFSPVDPHILYSTSNVVWKTRNGGNSWTKISPDLTRRGNWQIPASLGKYTKKIENDSKNRAVVHALAPSPINIDIIWAGTDDGLVQVTTDGGESWDEVTPPKMKPWWAVYDLEASHFDEGTAYAAINTMQIDDQRPHLFRTHDFGKTWKEIDTGITDSATTNVIIEDPKESGLLFAGTEAQVWVSFDDGNHWQSLRLNMPAISVRDLEIKANDLIAATHGRGFQVLDDITPLRQINQEIINSEAVLYKPEPATRVRWGMNPPTEWRMPFLNNPPPGAIIGYYLAEDVSGSISIDILDADGNLVRHVNSEKPTFEPIPEDELRVPDKWPRAPQILSTKAGHHRFIWNMHYAPIPGLTKRLDADQGVRENSTPLVATSPWVMPGQYMVKLTVGRDTYTQPLNVRMDPRVGTSFADLKRQFELSKTAYDLIIKGLKTLGQIRNLQKQLKQRIAGSGSSNKIKDYQKQLRVLAGPLDAGSSYFYGDSPKLSGMAHKLSRLMSAVQNADEAPTGIQTKKFQEMSMQMQTLLSHWSKLKGKPLVSLNKQFLKLDINPLHLLANAPVPEGWDIRWVEYHNSDA